MKKNSDIRNILVLTFLFLLSIIPLGFLTDASLDTFAYAPLPNTDYASPDLDLEYEALENMADYILVESGPRKSILINPVSSMTEPSYWVTSIFSPVSLSLSLIHI